MARKRNTRQQAFTAFVRPHLERLYRFAYRLTGQREDAQDLVQDVLLKTYSQADRIADIEVPLTWLSRVLYNQFIDNQRRYTERRLRLVSHDVLSGDPDLAASSEPSPEAQVAGEFTIKRLERALAQLSDDHRLIISLHDVEGYTIAEIAEITGISLGTLKSRRHRARQRLQNILDEGPESGQRASSEGRGDDNVELRSIPGTSRREH